MVGVVADVIATMRDHLLPFLEPADKHVFIEINALLHASSLDPEEAAVLETAMVMAKIAKEKAKRCEMLAKSRCQHLHVELGGNALPTAGKVRAVVLVDPESDLVVELCPSVKLAAESVGLSPTTLRRWCHRR